MAAKRARGRGERGAALLLVVLLISLLAMVVIEFQRRAGGELQAARNLRDSVQGHALSRSGLVVAKVLLLEDASDPAHSSYDGRDEFWNQVDLPVPLNDPTGRFRANVQRVEDLDGKFPLGALVDKQGIPQPKIAAAYERFLNALDQHLKDTPGGPVDILDQVNIPDLVDALVDWIDADDQGAFEDNAEFTVPNAPLTHLENLQRIEGYERVPEGFTHSVAEAILPYVDTRATAEVNMNTAQVPVLVATHPGIAYADAIDLFEDLGENPDTTKFDPKAHSSISGISVSQFDLTPKIVSERFLVRLLVMVSDVESYSEAIVVRTNTDVLTEQWREGWMMPQWRPAFVDPPQATGFLGLPGGL